MLKQVVESVAVQKLKGIIAHRYGKGLSIQSMQNASDIQGREESMYLKGHALHIPIQVHDHYFATAIVGEASDLSPEDKLSLSYMVRMVLEPEFYNWYLSQTANNAQNFSESENIVSIYQPHDLTQFMDDEDSEDEEIEQALDQLGNEYNDNIICLESRNPHAIPRLAFQIHEISQRWAFLKFSDIQAQVQSADDLMALGNLTLLIDDILEVSPEHQQIIEQYLSNKSIQERPLMIIGSASHIESLEDQGSLDTSFAQILKFHRLDTERLPRDSKLLQETLEFMLHI